MVMGVGRLLPGGRGLSASGLESFYAADKPVPCGVRAPRELELGRGVLSCTRTEPRHAEGSPGDSGVGHYHFAKGVMWSPADEAGDVNAIEVPA